MQFLEHIGAFRKDRATSTEGFTVAGILMFGKTDSITDPECCPYFYPDYRERLSEDPNVRWTNRIYPDGTWEANLYQFYTKVLPLLQHALPVPFRLDRNQMRIDTTTAHVALREAFANSLVHCAYTIMGNITIDRYPNRIVMSNPGTMLVSMEEYEEGGHSVCRNPILQKMFVFLGIGERGGSGADIIAKGWLDNGWNKLPTLRECTTPDRVETTLLIPNTSIELNTKNIVSDKSEIASDKPAITSDKSEIASDKPAITSDKSEIASDKPAITSDKSEIASDKPAIKRPTIEYIYNYVESHPNCKTVQVAKYANLSETQTRWYLRQLVEAGRLTSNGANKNRTYSTVNVQISE